MYDSIGKSVTYPWRSWDLAMNAKGEAQSGPLRLQFDRAVKRAFQGSLISSDGGLLLHRELDDALGLVDMAAGLITDPRTGRHENGGAKVCHGSGGIDPKR